MNKKKIISIVLSAFFAILFCITILLVQGANVRNKLVITNLKGKNSIETITIGSTTYYNDLFIDEEKGLTFDNDDLLLQMSGNSELIIEVSDINNVYVKFASHKSNGEVKVQYKDEEKTFNFKDKVENDNRDEVFVVGSSQAAVLKQTIKEKSNYWYVYMLIVLMAFIISYFAVSKSISIIIDAKKDKTIKLRRVAFLFIVYAVINLSSMLPIIEIVGKWYALFIFAQLIGIIYYFRRIVKTDYAILIPFFTIILTINMTILMPPFHVPDELVHFCRSYTITHPHSVYVDEGNKYVFLPSNVDTIIDKYMFGVHDYEYKTSVKEYYSDFSVSFDRKSGYTPIDYSSAADIRMYMYLPSAFVIFVGTLVNIPFILITILARLINALIFVLVATVAIKLVTKFKKLFFLVLLLPITIQQVAAINQDSVTLSIAFLLTAYIMSKIFDKKAKVDRKSYVILLVLSLLLGLGKEVYFVLPLLAFLIPKEKFETNSHNIILKAIPFVLCLGACMLRILSASKVAVTSTVTDYITLGYVFKHPFVIARIYLGCLYYRGSADLLHLQINMFGWSTVWYKELTSVIIYFIFDFLFFFDNKEKELTVKHRIMFALVGIMIFGLVYTSSMLLFRSTYPTSLHVAGLQSRYFIPALFPLYIAISNDKIKLNVKNSNVVVSVLVALLFLVSFFTIINGFYL